MRGIVLALLLLGGVALAAQDSVEYRDDSARDLFTRARFAVGASEVAGLKGLTMRGQARIDEDGQHIEASTEIRILLPDCYVRIDRAGAGVRKSGFCGDKLLSSVSDGTQESRPPKNLQAGLLRSESARFVRLLLGSTTFVSSRYALVLRSMTVQTGRPEPYRFEALGQNFQFTASVQLDPSTLLPLHVDSLVGNRIVSTAFSERRVVSGLKLPFKIVSTTDGKPVDELTLQEIVVNPPLTRSQFAESGS